MLLSYEYGGEMKMKKKQTAIEFHVTINDEKYTLSISQEESRKSMPNCSIYSCMTFDANMVPYKRFNIIYNRFERSYWAWTGNAIREDDRTFRNAIADLFNDGVLRLVA